MPDWVKTLPLTLVLPVVLMGASVGPDAVVSNISEWFSRAGFDHIPPWFSAKSTDTWVIVGAIVLAVAYAVTIRSVLRQIIIRHVHHKELLAEVKTQATVSMVVHRAPDPPGYNTPIWKAVEYVRQKLGDENKNKCFPDTLRALRQAALDGDIKIRGRREIDKGTQRTEFSDVRSDIPAEYWKASVLSAMVTESEGRDFLHTNPETAWAWGPKGVYEKKRYADLHVDMEEIRRRWP